MPVYRIEPSEGWDGIAARLAMAEPGDRIEIAAGRFSGSQVLRIPAGVRFSGLEGHELVYLGDAAAVLVEAASDVQLIDLAFSGYAGLDHADGGDGDGDRNGDEEQTIGLINIVESRCVRIEGCRVTAGARRRSCISVVFSRDVQVERCHVSGARQGVAFWGSEGSVSGCDAGWNYRGIQAAPWDGTEHHFSQVRIRANRSHDNKDAGICLFSSESDAIEGNESWANDFGIILSRDQSFADRPSQAVLHLNRCHNNKQAGICLASSESAGIEHNESWGNGNAGIILQRDPDSLDQPSRAVVRFNRCHDNKRTGICVASSQSEAMEQNECWGNDLGIFLLRGLGSPNQPSSAVLRSNRCHDNKQDGIRLDSCDSEMIEDNESWGNGECGIVLRRDPDSPDQPSRAVLRSNRCHANKQAGIGLISSESHTIEKNETWRNGNAGIILQRDPISPDHPSRAVLRSNLCHDNEGEGIRLSSSDSEIIEDNESWGNGKSGILLSRDSAFSDQPSRAVLRSNRCHDNKEAGIGLGSSESEAIESNQSWGNGNGGIMLQPDPNTPDQPSRAVLRSNCCHDNGGSGIHLLSSESEIIEDNDIWGNRKGGIILVRDKRSPEHPSQAALRSNRCEANGYNSVLFQGSTGSAIANSSKGNGVDGPEYRPESNSYFQVDCPIFSENRNDKALDLRAAYSGTLREAMLVLEPLRRGTWSPEGLAAFLTSGCSGCFRHFWIGHRRSPEDGSPSIATRRLDPRHWVARLADSAHPQLQKATLHPGGVVADVVAAINRVTIDASRARRTRWLALVSPEESDTDAILSKLAGSVEREASSAFRTAKRMASPQLLGMADGNAELRVRLITALMASRGKWLERVDVLWHNKVLRWLPVAAALVVTAVWMSGTGPAISDIFKARAAPLAEVLGVIDKGNMQWMAAASWLFAAIGLIILATSMALMPRHLAIGAHVGSVGSAIVEQATQSFPSKIVRALSERFFPNVRGWLSDRAELRWLTRRLFANGELAVLILRDVVAWRAGDVAWLNRIAGALPDDCALVTLIHIDGRLMLRPILIAPEEAPWAEELDLYFSDDEGRLRLRKAQPMAIEELDRALTGLFAPSQVAELRTGIARSPFSPIDLLPTLSLASAPTSRMILSRPKVADVNQQRPLVSEIIPAAADFFEGMELDRTSLRTDPLFSVVGPADAVQLRTRTIGVETWEEITGRLSGRRRTGDALGAIWSSGTDWEEYVIGALRLGIWLKVTALAERISHPVDHLAALRELEALVFLGQELGRLAVAECPVYGEGRYADAWNSLRLTIERLEAGGGHGDMVARYIAAEGLCIGVASELTDRLGDRIAMLFEQPAEVILEPAADACEQFCHETVRHLVDLSNMDEVARAERLIELRQLNWRELPKPLLARFEALIARAGDGDRSLATLFGKAVSEKEIESIVRLHAAFPVRVLFAMGAAAVRHVLRETAWTPNLPTPDADLAPIGASLIRARERLIREEDKVKALFLPENFAKGAAGATQGGQKVAEFLSKSSSADELACWLERSPGQLLDAFEAHLEHELRAERMTADIEKMEGTAR